MQVSSQATFTENKDASSDDRLEHIPLPHMSPEDTKPLLANRGQFHAAHGLAPPPISFPPSSTSSLSLGDPDEYDYRHSAYSGPVAATGADEDADAGLWIEGARNNRRREGIPNLTRDCLWS